MYTTLHLAKLQMGERSFLEESMGLQGKITSKGTYLL